MKNNTHNQESTVVNQLRDIRDKLNLELEGLPFEKIKEFLNSQKTLLPSIK